MGTTAARNAGIESIRESPVTQGESPATHSQPKVRHGRTPQGVLLDKRLTTTARFVYGLLSLHAFKGGRVYIGQRKLSELAGCGQKTVSRCIAELVERKHVEAHTESRGKRSNYKLTSPLFIEKPKRKGPPTKQSGGLTSQQRAAKSWASMSGKHPLDDLA